ncbi:MAG: alpha/beta fold hydrolase, partial [Nanoarchaeota archaeon]
MPKKKTFLITAVIFIIIGLGIYFLLNLNFILGNDVLIKLSVDKEYISLQNGGQTDLKMTISGLNNIFCTASCSLKFEDLSSGKIITNESYTLKSGNSISRNFKIDAPMNGEGSLLYRISTECSNEKTVFCPADRSRTERSVLIVERHELSSAEKLLRNDLQQRIGYFETRIEGQKNLLRSLSSAFFNMETSSESSAISLGIISAGKNIEENLGSLQTITSSWNSSDYYDASSKAELLDSSLSRSAVQLNNLNDSLVNLTERHNKMTQEFNESREILIDLSNSPTDSATAELISDINRHNLLANSAENSSSLEEREDLADKAMESSKSAQKAVGEELRIRSVLKDVSTDINFDILCALSGNCVVHPSPAERSEQEIADLNLTCATLAVSYPPVLGPHFYPIKINFTNDVVNVSTLPVPFPVCCSLGSCAQCCENSECSTSPEKYPIVLLHGHIVNDKLSAEHTLDAFDEMQYQLEKDGIINAGAVSLYTSQQVPQGVWGQVPSRFSIKGSYYFDSFLDQGSFVYIPMKSESIDSYSVRVKDIIETVKYRTGSPKVILVGYSMGGLVARRYIQLFGTGNVDRLILIATPNNGIEGYVEDYCPIAGARSECDDMVVGSVFLRKLNSESLPSIPIFNIVGTGCNMGSESGDA